MANDESFECDAIPVQCDRARRTWLHCSLNVAAAMAMPTWPVTTLAHNLTVGQPAPAIVLNTLDGQSLASNMQTGKVVILTFWATWCGPCREELPLLSAFARRYMDSGLQVFGFSLDTPEELPAVREMAATLSFPVGLLGKAWAGDYGRIWRLPVNFTIDREGRLADNGWDDRSPAWTEERLARVVLPLLRKAK